MHYALNELFYYKRDHSDALTPTLREAHTCHNHSQSVPVVPLEDTSILVRIHSTGLVHNQTRLTSPLCISVLRTGYACH